MLVCWVSFVYFRSLLLLDCQWRILRRFCLCIKFSTLVLVHTQYVSKQFMILSKNLAYWLFYRLIEDTKLWNIVIKARTKVLKRLLFACFYFYQASDFSLCFLCTYTHTNVYFIGRILIILLCYSSTMHLTVLWRMEKEKNRR